MAATFPYCNFAREHYAKVLQVPGFRLFPPDDHLNLSLNRIEPPMAHTHLRIAVVQNSPIFKNVGASVAQVDRVLSTQLAPNSTDLLVLPECAFTGYCFADRSEIEPFLEDASDGPTVAWAQRTAKQYHCAVIAGFPERAGDKAYNSAIVVDAEGKVAGLHRKFHLYERDLGKFALKLTAEIKRGFWQATEGASFTLVELPFQGTRIRIALTICMDLNVSLPTSGCATSYSTLKPLRFAAPFELYEAATFARDQKAQMVVCCMNWLKQEDEEDRQGLERSDWEKVARTVNYFAIRLRPLFKTDVVFVAADRVGTEQVKGATSATTFTGSSCILTLSDRPTLETFASQDREQLIQETVKIP